jgi:hypothetical protein
MFFRSFRFNLIISGKFMSDQGSNPSPWFQQKRKARYAGFPTSVSP